MKRILATVLAIIMVLGLSISASAARSWTPSGTAARMAYNQGWEECKEDGLSSWSSADLRDVAAQNERFVQRYVYQNRPWTKAELEGAKRMAYYDYAVMVLTNRGARIK